MAFFSDGPAFDPRRRPARALGLAFAWALAFGALSHADSPAGAGTPAGAAPAQELVLPAAPMPSAPVLPANHSGPVGQLVAKLLESSQYNRHLVDEGVSSQTLRGYLDELDYNHLIFDQADVDRFELRYADTLGLRIEREGDVLPAYEIFNKYVERLRQRVALVRELTQEKFDFDRDESIQLDRHDAPWPVSDADARELWRKRIKYELLQERLSKAKPEEQTKTVNQRYGRLLRSVLEFDSADVLQTYLNALAHTFDPHSDYFAESSKENFDISMRLSLVGIGAVLKSEDGYAKVVSLVPGGPADVDKRLKPNDRIEAVAQGDKPFEEVVGMKLDRLVQMIRGEKGTTVRIRVIPADARDPSARLVVSLVRDEIKLTSQEAQAKIIETPAAGGRTVKLGVIDLPSFYSDFKSGSGAKSTTRDVAKLVHYLEKVGVQGIAIDLRRNGGGALNEAVSLSELFIKQGPVVQVKDPNGRIKVLGGVDEEGAYTGPLVVLTSRRSASASEIFAGAMQDYGRAVVVGEKSTYGKGTVQSVLELARYLPAGAQDLHPGALKVTIQKFYRVSGQSTQNRGVIPDIQLPAVDNYLDITESTVKNAMPYDEVSPAAYSKLFSLSSELPALKKASAERVAASPEFGYIREDCDRVQAHLKDKLVSLNEKKRLAEKQADDEREEARKKDRAARHEASFKSLDVSLESIDGSKPAPAEPPAKSSASAEGSYEKAPPAPDAPLQEGLRILADLVQPPAQPVPVAGSSSPASK